MKTDTQDERTIARCHPTFRAALPKFILPLALIVSAYWLGWVAAALGALWLLVVLLRAAWNVMGDTYIFTERRVVKKSGIFGTSKTEVRVSDIRAVVGRKTLIGRILGYANIAIGTAAVGDMEIVMGNVANADTITQTIERLRAASS